MEKKEKKEKAEVVKEAPKTDEDIAALAFSAILTKEKEKKKKHHSKKEGEEGEERKHRHHSKKEGEEGEKEGEKGEKGEKKKHRHHSKKEEKEAKEELRVCSTNNPLEEAGKGYNLGVRRESRFVDGLRVQVFLDTVPVADVRDALVLLHHKRRRVLAGSSLLHYA